MSKKVTRPKLVNQVVNEINVGEAKAVKFSSLVDWVEANIAEAGYEPDRDATSRSLKKTLKVAEVLGLVKLSSCTTVERLK